MTESQQLQKIVAHGQSHCNYGNCAFVIFITSLIAAAVQGTK